MRVSSALLLTLLLGGSYTLTADILYSVKDLGTLGGCCSVGTAINNAGQVTGGSVTSAGFGHAFLYSSGQMTDLSILGGSAGGEGNAINNAGQVVGTATLIGGGTPYAFLYSNGQVTDLSTLTGANLTGFGINDAGQVTGSAATSTGPRAFVYSNEQVTYLSTLGGPAIQLRITKETCVAY
jgi:probable HAF family extracellular repeat protein